MMLLGVLFTLYTTAETGYLYENNENDNATTRCFKGVVLDGTNNQPLPGVNVLVTGTTNGTTTDFDGNFTLTNIKKGEKISFSYIGFTDETLIYENQKTITITLKEDQKELNKFNRSTLDKTQQTIYDELKYENELSLKAENKKFQYLNNERKFDF